MLTNRPLQAAFLHTVPPRFEQLMERAWEKQDTFEV
jgi:hypothetical protein